MYGLGPDVYDYYGPVTIRFRAEAGRSYNLNLKGLNDGSWEVWIEDARNHNLLDKRRTDRKPYMRSWDYMCVPLRETRNSN